MLKVDKMAIWQNDKWNKTARWLKHKFIKMTIWQIGNLAKLQVDKMASLQNRKLIKWLVDKMASWQLASLKNNKMTKVQFVTITNRQMDKLAKLQRIKWQLDKMASWQKALAPSWHPLIFICMYPQRREINRKARLVNLTKSFFLCRFCKISNFKTFTSSVKIS